MNASAQPSRSPRGVRLGPVTVVLAAAAMLALGAGAAHAATPGGAQGVAHSSDLDSADVGLGSVERQVASQAVLGRVEFGSDPGSGSALPPGGLAAALVLAGAGTVVATRAMCSGRGWR